MERSIKATVRRGSFAGTHHGQTGEATYSGKSSDGEDVYRVVFRGVESGLFRASDLAFESHGAVRSEA